MKKQILGFLTIAIVFLLVACDNSTPTPTPTPVDTTNTGAFKVFTIDGITTVQNLLADTIRGVGAMGPYGVGKVTFFNISTQKIVANSDSATTKWDLGFRGTTIFTNSGTSGTGQGGAFIFNGLFDNLKTISADSTFKVDTKTLLAIPTGSKKGWYAYDGAANLITAIPGKVLVIRTADGKFAKMEILNYYKKGVTPAATATDAAKTNGQRYYAYRFVYQPDGSKNFPK